MDAFVSEEGAAIAEVALRHLFRVHPLLFEALRKCNSGEAASVPEPLRRALQRYGVLSSNNELSGAMLSHAFVSLLADPASARINRDRPEDCRIKRWPCRVG